MEIIRNTRNICQKHRNCVVTIGNFDGMHLGHKKIISSLISISKKYNRPSVVITFEPHPEEFFSKMLGKNIQARLMNFREKMLKFREFGISYVLVLPFEKSLASLSPHFFVKNILVEQLNCVCLIAGEDFHFGKKCEGDVDYLKKVCKQYNFAFLSIPDALYYDNNHKYRISSTLIRKKLKVGEIAIAEKLLNHTFNICGRVICGYKRGRTVGFPTANININRFTSPLTGVFVVRVYGLDKVYNGVASIGSCSTFESVIKHKNILEVYIFDFDGDIYGHYLCVEFLDRIRANWKMSSVYALRQIIATDVSVARKIFLNLKLKSSPNIA